MNPAHHSPSIRLGYRDLVQNSTHLEWAVDYQEAELEAFLAEVDRRAAGWLSMPANRIGLICIRTGFNDRSWSDSGELVETPIRYETITFHRAYECFGLEFRNGVVYVLVQGDDGFPALVNSWCFEGIGGVPKNWVLSVPGGAARQSPDGPTNAPEIRIGYREFVTDDDHRGGLFARDREAVELFTREAEIRERDRMIY
ncbi:hypothetical protein [Parenemella sanctibonifatiensis]|uniref:Uncharacterized protein n=1 Tax=Parenemella sanctibonifatiensis TaxID=2016505 RepID=A0A255EB43_9ACTN|nr:hypothetical protein [Parenemella sanctibonifatiensis]OYN88778.1 hypothetical protein CGZ92_03465 [Parenemella sanctibonifatiensis]